MCRTWLCAQACHTHYTGSRDHADSWHSYVRPHHSSSIARVLGSSARLAVGVCSAGRQSRLVRLGAAVHVAAAPCRSASVDTRHSSHFLVGSSPISSLSLLPRGANPSATRRPLVGCCYVVAVTYWAACVGLASLLLSGDGFCIFRQTNPPRVTSSLRLTY